jgi:DNA-binding response OmpR family regulator
VMPGVDGLTLVDAYRANPRTANTPVVVLSGNDDDEMRRRALDRGAADYLVKLPSRDVLVACIRRHAARGAHTADSPPATAAPAPAADQTLDPSAIAAFRKADPAGSAAFVTMLIDQFLDEAASQVARLRDAATQADADTLKAVAHGLKGSATTIGAGTLAGLCGQMEHHAARAAVVPVLLTQIEQELRRVQEALAREREANKLT